MNYENALEYVYSRRQFAKSNGFERIEALLKKLGNPHLKLKFVHVVGTNGKGSVSTELSFITRNAGYKTGLFTSPFVTEFCERIQIDGEYIAKDEFSKIVEEIKTINDELENQGLTPTFFEVVFAAALIYFERQKCDIVILEAGIGGRTDSTNIIPAPLVTVITSISLDHTQVLGNTVKEIATEKCGVIKNGSVVVSYPNESGKFDFVEQSEDAHSVIENTCRQKNCRHIFPNINSVIKIKDGIDKTQFSFSGLDLSIKFTGDHQIANAAVAVTAAQQLADRGLEITDENIVHGLAEAFLPARMEIVSHSPLVIIDGGHNIGCITALSKMIKQHLKGKKIIAVLGFMKDKSYESAIEIIAPLCESIVCTLAQEGRGEDPKILTHCAEKQCKNVFCVEKPIQAFKAACEMANDDDVLICAGSFYLVSDIRNILII